MAAFNKINVFVENFAEGVHDLGADTLKIMLTNTAPVATNAVLGDLVDISATDNGYTAGGQTVTITSSAQTSGTYKLVGTDVVFTQTGAEVMGPFQYAVLYNSTPTTPLKPLIGWWDKGSAVTLSAGETFTVDFDGTDGILQLV